MLRVRFKEKVLSISRAPPPMIETSLHNASNATYALTTNILDVRIENERT
jgi:hypothetical protein